MSIYKLYNGDVQLHFDEKKHTYKVDRQLVASVTGITGVVTSPALMYWAVNQATDYVSRTWKAGVVYDEIEIKEILEDAKKAHRKVSSSAALIGTIAHDYVQRYSLYRQKKIDKPRLPVNPLAEKSCLQFVDWVDKNDVTFHDTEFKIYSKTHNYAGTVDADITINKKRYIVDYKTSSGIYPDMGLQLAGYQLAREEEGVAKYDSRMILRLPKNGSDFEFREFPDYDADKEAFLACLAYKTWQDANKSKKSK